ncbi:MAG: thiamine-monophosphate kinase, partial [Acidimicrobiaceae bacterium]|nr:thiamine-monophosphate kinase [Acidimicrobiaceae bacterium]
VADPCGTSGQPVGAEGELAALGALERRLNHPPPGEVWIGDDAAVLEGQAGPLLFASDLVAEGVHFDRRLSSLADVGWKAMAVNLSDMAAMGGRPLRAVVALAGAFGEELEACYDGLVAAAERYGCPVVGGDLSGAPTGGGLVCSIAVLGTAEASGPVLRSGARPGDELWVTGPLGASAAGLRLLEADPRAEGPLVDRHRRPLPRLAEGRQAAACGASAMIDVSDGLGLDLDRLARASGVGIRLGEVPIAPGATESEALGGGEDYELAFAVSPGTDVTEAFARAGLDVPLRLGEVVADTGERSLHGGALAALGWLHGPR